VGFPDDADADADDDDDEWVLEGTQIDSISGEGQDKRFPLAGLLKRSTSL
jgi:hypothetical protein